MKSDSAYLPDGQPEATRHIHVSRVWHGWTSPANADAYERLLRSTILPGIAARKIAGYHGAYLYRRQDGDEVEFVTTMLFESLENVRAFAGDAYEQAVVPPAARQLLARWDAQSAHYDILEMPAETRAIPPRS